MARKKLRWIPQVDLKAQFILKTTCTKKMKSNLFPSLTQQMSSNKYMLALKERISGREPNLLHAFMF
jgi:hypothetical protein